MGFIAAAVVAAGATIYAAQAQSSATKKASEQNAQNVMNTNQLNYNMFQQSRGSKGNAVLPLYLTGANGQSEESILGQNAIGLYGAAGGNMTPAQQIAMYQALQSQFQPMQAGANATAQGIFNGNLQAQELQNYAPVATAMQQGVAAQKEGSLEGLQATLNQIKAIQAGQGFSGDSFGTNLLASNALRSTFSSNAALQSAANTTIAGAQSGIKQGVLGTQLSNLNLPNSMASENFNFANAPQNAALAQEGQRQQLFNMFRIGTGQFQYQNLPMVPPIPNIRQNVGQGVGALAGAVGRNYSTNGGNAMPSWLGGGAANASDLPANSGWNSDPSLDPFGSQYTPVSTNVDPSQVGQYQAISGDMSSDFPE